MQHESHKRRKNRRTPCACENTMDITSISTSSRHGITGSGGVTLYRCPSELCSALESSLKAGHKDKRKKKTLVVLLVYVTGWITSHHMHDIPQLVSSL